MAHEFADVEEEEDESSSSSSEDDLELIATENTLETLRGMFPEMEREVVRMLFEEECDGDLDQAIDMMLSMSADCDAMKRNKKKKKRNKKRKVKLGKTPGGQISLEDVRRENGIPERVCSLVICMRLYTMPLPA